MNDPQEITRGFFIGDEWLYYKFYSGPKTADTILSRIAMPLCEDLIDAGRIDKWFFIRYSDPHFHVRLRLHVTDTASLSDIVSQARRRAAELFCHGLIWKVQVDTYWREIERYGASIIGQAEDIFFHDSEMIASFLGRTEGDDGERTRWLFGLRALDSFLGDFNYSANDKAQLISKMRQMALGGYLRSQRFRDQLEKKYRAERPTINLVMNDTANSANPVLPFVPLIDKKSRLIRETTAKIIDRLAAGLSPQKDLDRLFASFSHMMLNRLFRSRHQLHEMILYDFLSRYYRSVLGRQIAESQAPQELP